MDGSIKNITIPMTTPANFALNRENNTNYIYAILLKKRFYRLDTRESSTVQQIVSLLIPNCKEGENSSLLFLFKTKETIV